MGTEKNYKRGNFYYTFFYFLYMNSKFHYKYAGLFFVQTDHHTQWHDLHLMVSSVSVRHTNSMRLAFI